MGRIFVIVGGLLVLLLTAALVVPPFVDWSGYRADFEREASRILGRPVHVTGDVSARLLPFPSVAFSDVRVGADSADPVMTVDTFSMDAELMPFLRGQLLIFDMRVERPTVNISLDKDGKVDWAIRPSTPIDPSHIKVERLSITDGTATLGDELSGRVHTATAINAVLSANSLAGPWQASGTLDIEGQKLALDLNSGEAKSDGSLRLRARISPQAIPASFETDGDLILKEGRLNYAGNFSLRSADAVSPTGQNQKTPTDKPFFSDLRVSGKFNADRSRFDASEFRMEQGPADNPYVVNGKALIDYGDKPHFEISADGQQVFWGPVETTEDQAAVPVPVNERLAPVRRMLEQLPIPNMPGNVDLRLPAVIAGGTTIRSVMISAEPDGKRWNIRQFAADLPGRTKIEAKGKLSVGRDFGFDGDMLVASRQPSGLASWLNETVDESIRKLDSVGFSGKVNLREGVQSIDDLEIGMGKTTLKGNFLRQVIGSADPAITLRLQGGAVDSTALRAFIGFFSSGHGMASLGGQALDIAFKAGPVQYEDMEAGNVDLAVRMHDGRFDFDRLMINDVAGTTLTATGSYEPFATAPSGTLDATLLSADLSHFLTLVAHRHPQIPFFRSLSARADNYPGLFDDTQINIIANAVAAPSGDVAPVPTTGNDKGSRTKETATKAPAKGGEASFSVTGKAGGMKLDLSGTTSGGSSESDPVQMQLNGTATSQNGETVLALLGVPSLPLGLAGELTADLTMQGAPSAGMRTQLKLTAPDGTALADGILSLVGGDIAASGKASIKSADLQPFIATAGYTLPGFGEGLSADLSSDFQFAKGLLRFPNFAGKLGGDDVTARLEANFADSGLPQIKGEAKLASLNMSSLAAIMLGQDALEPSNNTKKSIWPKGAFSARPSLPLLLDMKLNVAQADMGSFGIISDFSTRLQKGMDHLNLNELTGNWGGGYLVGNVSLRNNDKAALLNSDLKWSGADLANIYRPEIGHPFAGGVKTAMTLNGSGSSIAELVASLTGSGSIEVENLTINGVDPAAFPNMLKAADAIVDQPAGGTQVDAKQFMAIAETASGNGRFVAGNSKFDVSIAGGIVRLGPVSLRSGNTLFAGDMQIDLSTLGLSGNGSFAFDGAEETDAAGAASLRYVVSGTYDDPSVNIDRQPLVQFLTQRALEREQERVEAMQASIMEKQRLRRQLDLLSSDAQERERLRLAEEARLKAEAQAREQAAREALEAQRPAVESNPPTELNGQGGQSLNEFLRDLEQSPADKPKL
ncbi:AsmA family protein [Brucella thiophenivorans]|uniref:AsmA-like C-terminal region family protein n=1 Tax=Brucella thiophenivorans TaxID=571255 RepID=A0A256G5X5_9HYPH|nr:AsmA family protein [Brucella thiophenivorans]OYR22366.1 asmA-like C-terminal region family protein [Brucella thiophenivorans]